MMYKKTLAEEKAELILRKEQYGYDNAWIMEFNLPCSEIDWIKMHLLTPIDNLRNGLEITLDEEDYETAAIITKIIQWLESDENEIVFELKNTENYKQLKVLKKREENS